MGPPKKKVMDDLKNEVTIQAVVIADSFDSKFGPITQNKPRVKFQQKKILKEHLQNISLSALVLVALGQPPHPGLHAGVSQAVRRARGLRLLHLIPGAGL